MQDLRFPTGTFAPETTITPEKRRRCIQTIAATPRAMREAVAGLDDAQLDTPYRPDGWSVRQVLHHVPDSHMNAYLRFKLALTEDNPTIKTYKEAEWAKLADTRGTPPEVSLSLLEAVHHRWIVLLESLRGADFERPLVHPEQGQITLDRLLQLYAWHGPHHVAHITGLRKRNGW
jgi:hypothetical protein